jgi:hypothetical protein
MMSNYVIAVYVSSDPGTYMVRIRFTFKKTGCDTILNIRLGRFMLGNLIVFLTMHSCIKMRLLALGVPHMLKCLERKFLLHQMSIMFLLRLLIIICFN